MKMRLLLSSALLFVSTAVFATPVVYDVDPDHTHPGFEADHFGGMSVWRGLFARTHGSILLDRAAGTGSVDIHTDASSVLTGQDKVDEMIKGPQLFDVTKYPELHYQGTLGGFKDGVPTAVTGTLTMHGVTK